MKVIFRVDASLQIGTGHVVRCLTLADELKSVGADILFICRAHSGHLKDMINSRGFQVRLLECSESSNSNHDGVLTHEHWLRVEWQQDADDVVKILGNEKIEWLIVDHYGIDSRWHRVLKEKVEKIFVIDDLADRQLDCDLLLDQNYYEKAALRYKNLVNQSCTCLLGPNYALLRPEFISTVNQFGIRERDSFKQIIVFMGGADMTNETKKIILAMDQINNCDFKADIIVGAINPHAYEVRQMCEERKFATFYQNVQNISEMMNKADISVGGGGATTLERCFLKLPSLVAILAENQKESIEDLKKAGAIESLGWYEDIVIDDVATQLNSFCHKPQKLKEMSVNIENILGQSNYHGVKGLVKLMLEA